MLQLLTAGFGTSRTSGDVRRKSAKWAKADIDQVVVTNLDFIERKGIATTALGFCRQNGRYWITTPHGPQWHDIGREGVDPALNFLFIERER